MRFVAVDVETANPDLASICQIGIVAFENGSVTNTWQTLVDPEDYFDPWNTAIHGITEQDVKGSPTIAKLFPDLRNRLEGNIVVCHTPFDKVALSRASQKYKILDLSCSWLDTARVVRRAWNQYSRSGYGLVNVCEYLGILFEHHIAQEDARAAGEVLLCAMRDTGLRIDEWLIRVNQPIDPSSIAGKITRTGNPDGPLAGEVLVFTGALMVPRREAADLAAKAGCDVAASVNKHTTLLVVGDQDLRKLAGNDKSNKHRKAEELIAKGQAIRILKESDFVYLVNLG